LNRNIVYLPACDKAKEKLFGHTPPHEPISTNISHKAFGMCPFCEGESPGRKKPGEQG